MRNNLLVICIQVVDGGAGTARDLVTSPTRDAGWRAPALEVFRRGAQGQGYSRDTGAENA